MHRMGLHNDMAEYMKNEISSSLRWEFHRLDFYRQLKVAGSFMRCNDFGRGPLHHLAMVCQKSPYGRNKKESQEEYSEGLEEILRSRYTDEERERMVNKQDVDGMTPLMYAVNNPSLFQILLNLGADRAKVDKRGWSVSQH